MNSDRKQEEALKEFLCLCCRLSIALLLRYLRAIKYAAVEMFRISFIEKYRLFWRIQKKKL